jgi:hypothetical protein
MVGNAGILDDLLEAGHLLALAPHLPITNIYQSSLSHRQKPINQLLPSPTHTVIGKSKLCIHFPMIPKLHFKTSYVYFKS